MSGNDCQDSSRRNSKARTEFIFNFHGLGEPARPLEPGEDNYWLSPGRFETVLDHLMELDRTSCDVTITFDDGNASDLELALPLLLARNLTARFFVLAGRLDTPHFLSRSDVRTLSRAGMKIGTHGFSHVDWRFASDDVLERELCEGRDELAAVLGQHIGEIAIPYGAYDRRVLQRLKRCGYGAVFTSDGGTASYTGWLRPRTCIRRDTELSEIDEIVDRNVLMSALLPHARRVKRYLYPAQRYPLS